MEKNQKVYEYEVTDVYTCKIPVLASDQEKADEIYEEWESSVKGGLMLDDMLDNGYLGRTVIRQSPIDAATYPLDDILLPIEKETPEVIKPYYNIHVRFNDGHIQNLFDRSLTQMLNDLSILSNDYILFPDPNVKKDESYIEVMGNGMDTTMWFYAVKKEKEVITQWLT